ncbi:DUF2079 domain-containing protein [Streptacidiphilus cavernicola]|uniref:DUF2079 domain-containing protein n=1 Tax=Streptacidiphilus cavernicola TaxID=3342716 RepID=A0ABV6W5W3_9ACTN
MSSSQLSPSPRTAVRGGPPSEPTPAQPPWWQRARVQAWGLAGVFFALYCCLSVRRQQRILSTGFDLGIFEQGIRGYAHGHAPVSLLKGPGFDLLGDHFHPLLVLFAPFYRLFPGPLTLLVGQAALTALAVVPLVRWAHRVRGPWAAAWTGLGFGASWGLASMIGFDFHEVCLAVPLLAFALAAAGQRRWRAAALWGLPLLLVKEDLGLTLAVLGGCIAWKGPRRLGLALAVAGVLGTLLEVLVILPAVNQHGSFDYWNEIAGGSTAATAHSGSLTGTVLHTFWPPEKYLTVLLLLAPTGFLALRSPLVLLALPTLGWRFVSANPAYWGTADHYSAVLMVVVWASTVQALDQHREVLRGPRLRLRCGAGALVTAVCLPLFPLGALFLPGTWTTTAHVRAAHRVLDRIPDGATVASTDRLAPQLTDRAAVSLVCSPDPPTAPPDWILVDRADSTNFPCPITTALAVVAADERSGGYRLVTDQDGIVLLHRQ